MKGIKRVPGGWEAEDPAHPGKVRFFLPGDRGMRRALMEARRWQAQQKLLVQATPPPAPRLVPSPRPQAPSATFGHSRSKAQNLELSVREARKLGAEVEVARGTGEYLFYDQRIGTCRVNCRRKDSPRALSLWLRKLARTSLAAS